MSGWATLRSTQVYDSPHLQVLAERVATPTRPEGCDWTVVRRRAAAVIAPLTAEGRWLLIRQERVAVRTELWEFPAGQIETGEPEETAHRELREETGWELHPTGELVPLGLFFPSPGFTDEVSHLFLARGVVPSAAGAHYDPQEAITDYRAFSSAELRDLIATGEIRDANTLASFARLIARGLLPC